METPLVSVYVVTYNQEDVLHKALDSILMQETTFSYEIIVGEDCSTDNTCKVLEEYAKKYPQIRPIYNEKNLGIIGNVKNVLSHVRGKYVSGCAGDDQWLTNTRLQRQVDIMENNSQIGVVYADARMDILSLAKQYIKKSPEPSSDLLNHLMRGNFIIASTACYRSELLQYVNFDEFIEKDFFMEDYPMWLEFSQHCQFYHIPETLVNYVVARPSILNPDEALIKACKFDEHTTRVRMHYARKFSDKCNYTVEQIKDEHIERWIKAYIINNKRLKAIESIYKLHLMTRYYKILNFIFHVPCGFGIYRARLMNKRKTLSSESSYFS
ncbi:MAG: glycosyltransferase [Paludibacteraceae bacterium]|nr:glycosyltransferase [Paludibacteraceae bacterium]